MTAGLLIVNTAAWGGQLKVTPSIGASTKYDDNITYKSNNAIDDFIFTLTPGLNMSYDTGITKFNFKADMDVRRYLSESRYDNESYRLNLSFQHLVTERMSLGLNGSYTADTTLDSELEETGYVSSRSNREYFSGGAALQYRLTELTSVGLGYNRSRSNYDGPNTVDSDSESVSLSYSTYFNDGLDSLSISPYYSTSSSTASDVNTYGLSVGMSHIFSERLYLSFSIGARYTETERDLPRIVLVTTPIPHLEIRPFRDTAYNWGTTGDLTLTYEGDQWSANFGYNRGLNYTDQGDAVDTQTFRAGASYHLTERLTGRINGSVYQNSSEEEGRIDAWRYQINPGLSYVLTENANLDFNYSFSYSEDDTQNGDGDVTRHQVVLSFRYNFPLEY